MFGMLQSEGIFYLMRENRMSGTTVFNGCEYRVDTTMLRRPKPSTVWMQRAAVLGALGGAYFTVRWLLVRVLFLWCNKVPSSKNGSRGKVCVTLWLDKRGPLPWSYESAS